MTLRDYTFLGLTQSLCPRCRRVVPAKILARGERVYFRKSCPEHGTIEDFVLSDVRWFDRHEHSQPARMPASYATEARRGCPLDCGLCPEHEQHTCIGLVEVTSSCNLECPMCYAGSGPGGEHMAFETYAQIVDRFVRQEGGEADVLQISGGEPTIHPDIVRMARYACERPIQVVMINTNGIRLAKDPRLVEALASMRDRLEVYLQFDGFAPKTYEALRGESLLDVKVQALEALAAAGIRTTLVCTVQGGLNLHEVADVVKFGLERKWVRGVSFQPATFTGRSVAPEDLERRATIPDVVKGIVEGMGGVLAEEDFLPLPCAHPNCHLMTWLYRGGDKPVPITRLVDLKGNMDLVANTMVYTPKRARSLVEIALDRAGGCCGPGKSCGPEGDSFLETALAEKLTGAEMFRITLTAFLDAHIFDVRRVMKCCIGFLLPSGHTVPFCAYNTLYRDGHVPLPPLAT